RAISAWRCAASASAGSWRRARCAASWPIRAGRRRCDWVRSGRLRSSVARVLAVPTVSVIVVTRDRPAFLADALAGVAAQEEGAPGGRVGDDGGGSSVAVVEPLPLLEVTLLPLSIGQAGAARNAAAAGARGEVLAFLDDDDVWMPGHLAGLSAAFADPGVGLA